LTVERLERSSSQAVFSALTAAVLPLGVTAGAHAVPSHSCTCQLAPVQSRTMRM
tara:strand:+ start:10421 stop:10582 length:162 start_codon:yes stop_codon:yes gene_type:complete